MNKFSVSIAGASLCALLTWTDAAVGHPDDRYWAGNFPEYTPHTYSTCVIEWNGRITIAGPRPRRQPRLNPLEYTPYAAYWDGEDWQALPGFTDPITGPDSPSSSERFSIAVHDGELVGAATLRGVSGYYVQVRRWDGARWRDLGAPLDGREPDLIEHDGELLMTGSFRDAMDMRFTVARWTGTEWSALPGLVEQLWTDGQELLGIGTLVHPDDSREDGVLRWTGTDWQLIAPAPCSARYKVARFQGELVAVATSCYDGPGLVLHWDGSEWLPLGGGIADQPELPSPSRPRVTTLLATEDELWIAGTFTEVGGVAASNVAVWDGSTWSPAGAGLDDVADVLATVGSTIVATGYFATADGRRSPLLAIWDGQEWNSPRQGAGMFLPVTALFPTELGLLATGDALETMDPHHQYILRWNGVNWEEPFPGLYGHGISQILVHEGEVHVGGYLSIDRGDSLEYARVARFDGANWQTVLQYPQLEVFALCSWGSQLVIGGESRHSGGRHGFLQIRGDGTESFEFNPHSWVLSLGVHDGDLYAGGSFTEIDGVSATMIARFDGTSWSSLGSGAGGTVSSLASMDSVLYVGGYFNFAGGTPAASIARWDGSSWSAVGDGLQLRHLDPNDDFPAVVNDLIVHDGELYAGGDFTRSGSVATKGVARWDGNSWETLGSGLSGVGMALASWDGALWVGGNSRTAGTTNSGAIARWSRPSGLGASPPAVGVRIESVAPNPFNPASVITFSLAQPARAQVDVYDVRGRRVIRLLDAELSAGPHAVQWFGTDESGKAVASGVYIVRVNGAGSEDGEKVTLVR